MHRIIIQYATDKTLVPKAALLRKWARKALQAQTNIVEMTIRIVGVEEMSALNSAYRKKHGPTNVLSFPFEMPSGVQMDATVLGDIVICAQIVNQEAATQYKSQDAHWAHMIVHGIFHLLGYDHETDKDAEIMEALEIKMLQSLKFPNPYATGENIKNYG